MEGQRGFIVAIAFAVIIFSFSVNSIITRFLVSGGLVGPIPLTIIRFISGFITLQLMVSALPGRFEKAKVVAPDVIGALLLGLYAFAISFGYFFIPAGAGALVFYGMVVATMTFYSILKEGERLSLRVLFGLLLGISGIFTLTFGGIGNVSAQGVALMTLTGTSWGLYSVYGRKSGSSFGYTYNSFLFLGVACGLLGIGETSLAGTQQWASVSLPSLALAVYMGTVSTALIYVAWNGVLKRVSSSLGGLSQLLVPLLTAALGVVFLTEKVSASLLAGGALVLAGIYINGSRSRTQNQGGTLSRSLRLRRNPAGPETKNGVA